MLGIILLIIGGVGLALTLLSLFGLDFGDFDFDLGDGGVGLLSLVTPFATGFGLLGGGLMQFTDTPTWLALLVGLATGVGLSLVAVVVLGYLVGSEEELPTLDYIGSMVRVVEPVSPGRFGLGEVATALGAQQLTITADETLEHNASAVVVEKMDGRDSYVVVRYTEPA
ncbi:hypothetical protein [Gordonia phthalatica]|uniref:NfeD-like C-terminal domain-containing protein n=1 Tax=Gordonia phthalatica TaxID=1136941 RepID=A0A0N9MQ36_9ACTN|nr:hypothetical protein [Gordonia phthalatica]ALG84940.1 hypothetical protein ACH46_11085 [Gordonia phthalatica]